MKLFLTYAVLLCMGYCYAQPRMIIDEQLKKLVDKHIAYNKGKKCSSGYRVQIHFGNQRQKAQEIKASFESLFHNIPAYLSYDAPNFKVRVGDCKTRWEAVKILEEIRSSFDIAFIVRDDIALPKL